MYSTYIIIAILIQAIAVLILMRQMMQNKTSVKPYFAWKANKYSSLQFNYSLKIIGFILLGGTLDWLIRASFLVLNLTLN